jgi:hypothetical protein
VVEIEQRIEGAVTGMSSNMILGGVGMAVVQFFFYWPEEVKTLLFWATGIGLSLFAGYMIQRYYRTRKVNYGVLVGGVMLGVLVMLIMSPFVNLIAPWLPTDAPLEASLQGAGAAESQSFNVALPAVAAAGLFGCVAVYLLLRRR